jgi:predicted DNA-binding protein
VQDTKNINIEISFECWKKLKMLSIYKEITLQNIVREILEKYITTNKVLINGADYT